MSKTDKTTDRQQFLKQLDRYRKGSITRRQFLGVTGLGAATAVMAGAMPGLIPRKSFATTRPILRNSPK